MVGPSWRFSKTSAHRRDFKHYNPLTAQLLLAAGAVTATRNGTAHHREYADPLMNSGLSMHTVVTGQLVGDHSVFKTNLWFFAAAATVELACVAAIAPMYWGFWKLGRPVSFSPLELAKVSVEPTVILHKRF
jgi:hypothetical protein